MHAGLPKWLAAETMEEGEEVVVAVIAEE